MANALTYDEINGVVVSGTPETSQVLTATSPTTATWEAGGGGGGITPPAGDIGGTASDPTVVSTHLTAALPLAQGGTASASAQAAMNTLAGAVTSGDYLRGNGTNAVMAAIQAADVPTLNQSTTGNAATATTATTATAANGLKSATTTVAVSSASAPSAGQVLTATSSTAADWASLPASAVLSVVQYAPASVVTDNGGDNGTWAAFSTSNINTGSFTAPASGNVLITVQCSLETTTTSTTDVYLSLATHGSTTPAANIVTVGLFLSGAFPDYGELVVCQFHISGLTAGSSYEYDLIGTTSNTTTVAILALGSTTYSASQQGSPVIISVQGL